LGEISRKKLKEVSENYKKVCSLPKKIYIVNENSSPEDLLSNN